MKSLASSVLVVVLAAGCSSPASPTSSSRTLSGAVTESPGGAVANATIRITDGPDAGAATKTDASGFYRFSGLTSGTTMHVSASVEYGDSVKEFTLSNGVNRLDFSFAAPVFLASGVGNASVRVPSRVTRARVSATYTGPCTELYVRGPNNLDIWSPMGIRAGSCDPWDFAADDFYAHFDFTFNLVKSVNGATLTVTAPGVSWSIEEVR